MIFKRFYDFLPCKDLEIRKKDITIENEGFANEVLMRFFILFVLIIALDLLE